jgi:hypothetical protein
MKRLGTKLQLSKKTALLGAVVLFPSLLVVFAAYHFATPRRTTPVPKPTTVLSVSQQPFPSPIVTVVRPTPTLMPQPTPNPVPNPASVLGVDVDAGGTFLSGISWVRLAYPTCGWGNLRGSVLKATVAQYHARGMHVLVIICQPGHSGPQLFNTQQFNDVAQSYPDAVQCGNEQMKQDALTTYVTPGDFARFYDLCSRAVHALQPNAPVLMGALDPHVSGPDDALIAGQVSYLDQMQTAMNTQVHPGGHWSWRSQAIGLIDSWHNGYPSQDINNLYALYVFWAQQFGVNLNGGALGHHLWVVEGTGCFKGCGIDDTSPYQVAVSHILTLISDVQTTRSYGVPFFYFSDRDFIQSGVYWPIGILDVGGNPKPIRQDLPMGARSLSMGCAHGQVNVVNQLQLLATMYQGCSLPGNYLDILTS